jgi:hypothetical protein
MRCGIVGGEVVENGEGKGESAAAGVGCKYVVLDGR